MSLGGDVPYDRLLRPRCDLLHRRAPPSVSICAGAARSRRENREGVMLWKLTPEQFDRFLLGVAAILTVLFAVVAFALALFVF
jgi:hypothetical protein